MGLSIKDGDGVSRILPAPMDPTFHAAKTAVAAVTSATDVVQLKGSATKTVRVLKCIVKAVPGITTAASQRLTMSKRSTAASGGTINVLAANTVIAQHDSADAAATAVLNDITATATIAGTRAGLIKDAQLFFPAATGDPGDGVVFDAIAGGDKPVVLNGVAEFFTIGFEGATPGNTFSWEIVWSEGT